MIFYFEVLELVRALLLLLKLATPLLNGSEISVERQQICSWWQSDQWTRQNLYIWYIVSRGNINSRLQYCQKFQRMPDWSHTCSITQLHVLKHGNQSSKSTGVAAAAPRRGCRYLCDRPIQSIPVWTQKYMNHYSWLQTTQDLIIPPFVTCQWSGISGTIPRLLTLWMTSSDL